MRVVIRADASTAIGTGHVMRCLALAEVLRDTGAQVSFICRTAPGDLAELIEQRGYGVTRLPAGAATTEVGDAEEVIKAAALFRQPDYIVVDHYGLGISWERRLKATSARLMAIDDLVDRPHDIDLLLDQNLPIPGAERAREMVPSGCLVLQGPRYALLRKEFAKARSRLRKREGALKTVLVYYGGSDPDDETSRTLQALADLPKREFAIDVVVGMNNPRRAAIEALCYSLPQTQFFCQVDNIAQIMARADFSFGAGGASSWERCCVGLPAALTVLAANQAPVAETLHFAGGAINLGPRQSIAPATIQRVISSLTPAKLVQMESVCLSIADGEGAERVAVAMARAADGKVS